MEGLPPDTGMIVGFGTLQAGYEWIGEEVSDRAGALAATVEVPDWAEANRVHFFFVTLPDQPPVGTSPGFHVTAPDGTLRLTGEVTEVVMEPAAPGAPVVLLQGDFEVLYCLSGNVGDPEPGQRVRVEGIVAGGASGAERATGSGAECADAIPVEASEVVAL